jgi:hypothetical protein
MTALTQSEMLGLWERGRSLHPLDQGVLALRTAFRGAEDAADWPLGRRNRALAELRAGMFGQELRGWTRCRQCNGQIEFQVDVPALLQAAGEEVEAVAFNQCFRLPSSRDLAAVLQETDADAAVRNLVVRCWLAEGPAAKAWSEDELEAVGDSMAAADPLAEIRLHFDCPHCGESFDDSLDPASFLWAEIDAVARRLLAEVHELAAAYGWSEREILSLSQARREIYLGMVRA